MPVLVKSVRMSPSASSESKLNGEVDWAKRAPVAAFGAPLTDADQSRCRQGKTDRKIGMKRKLLSLSKGNLIPKIPGV